MCAQMGTFMCACSCVLLCVFNLAPCHLFDDRSKVGWSVQLNSSETLEIRLQHALDPHTVRVLYVEVLQQETEKKTPYFSYHHLNLYNLYSVGKI